MMAWQVRQTIVLLLTIPVFGLSITAIIFVQKYFLPFPTAIPWIDFGFAVMYVGLVFLDSKEHFLYHGKLQTFLFILSSYIAVVAPVIMAVIAGVYAFSADARMCTSELHWKRWFQYKDEEVIRSIQESFRCCGFNSMRDRAWPFPSRDTDAGACQRTSGFRTHCGPLWEDQLQVTARLCLMASVLLHLLLILFLARVLFDWKSREIPPSSGALSEQTRLLDPAFDDVQATFARDRQQHTETTLP